jgi:phosphoglycerate dehydrogenase-like enzyme
MSSVIVVNNEFDGVWPFAADYFRKVWEEQGKVQFIRLAYGDNRPLEQIADAPDKIKRLVCLGYNISLVTIKSLSALEELAVDKNVTDEVAAYATDKKINIYMHPSEGYWKESVAEFAVALTICGLRRIPQLHQLMQSNKVSDFVMHPEQGWDMKDVWKYTPALGQAIPGGRGNQYCDDSNFTNGTVTGKRIRIVGAGNIATHYAKIMSLMGAEVAAYDPFVSEPCFDLAGMRREIRLNQLVKDAEIFAPMIPLNASTQGFITSELIDQLPKGCLIILVTRACVCNMEAIRQRVLKDEISLAADVFDIEPLPLNDALMGRHNVVHTPHIAGRTRQANESYVRRLAVQFNNYHDD